MNKHNEMKTARDLNIGDSIILADGAYMCATVVGRAEDHVVVFRPYVHISTSPVCDDAGKIVGWQPSVMRGCDGVDKTISYIGSETLKLVFCDSRKFRVVR